MTDLSDPIAAFRAAVDVLNTESWSTAADVVDPVSLRVFTNQLRARIAPAEPLRMPTADDFLASDQQLPRSIAEHFAEQARRYTNPTLQLQQELPTIDSVDTVRSLSAEKLYAAWLDGRSMRRQVGRLGANNQISAEAADVRASAGYAIYRYVAIGAVPDGPNIAYVVYRTNVDRSQTSTGEAAAWLASRPEDEQQLAHDLPSHAQPNVATMRRQPDGTWRLVVTHDFLNISRVFASRVAVRQENAEDDAPAQ